MRFFASQKNAEPFSGVLEIDCVPTRNGLMKELYSKGVVEASEFSAHCSDKLCFARMVEFLAPGHPFHPKTRGLFELMPEVSRRIMEEFRNPLVKPVAAMESNGEGFYFDMEVFFQEFERDPERFLTEEISPLTGILSSGERYLVQEKVGGKEQEYRLHTLEGRVVSGATFTRWDQDWDTEKFFSAEQALQAFLDSFPKWFTARQAWSFDVIEGEKGFFMVEVNTNRGRQRHWGGDLVNPDTLRAYALHLEKYYGAKFVSEGARRIYQGEADPTMYLEKFSPEAVKRHEELRKYLKLKK